MGSDHPTPLLVSEGTTCMRYTDIHIALGMHVVHRHTYRHNTHTHNILFLKSSLRSTPSNTEAPSHCPLPSIPLQLRVKQQVLLLMRCQQKWDSPGPNCEHTKYRSPDPLQLQQSPKSPWILTWTVLKGWSSTSPSSRVTLLHCTCSTKKNFWEERWFVS